MGCSDVINEAAETPLVEYKFMQRLVENNVPILHDEKVEATHPVAFTG